MAQISKVSVRISREKLKKGDYTPDKIETLEIITVSDQEQKSYLDAAAEFLYHRMFSNESQSIK